MFTGSGQKFCGPDQSRGQGRVVWVFALTALNALNVFLGMDESEILVRGIGRFDDLEVRVVAEPFLKQVDEILIPGMGENVPQVILF